VEEERFLPYRGSSYPGKFADHPTSRDELLERSILLQARDSMNWASEASHKGLDLKNGFYRNVRTALEIGFKNPASCQFPTGPPSCRRGPMPIAPIGGCRITRRITLFFADWNGLIRPTVRSVSCFLTRAERSDRRARRTYFTLLARAWESKARCCRRRTESCSPRCSGKDACT